MNHSGGFTKAPVARDNLFRCYSISRFRFLCCFKKMENVINFFGLAARATFSEKPWSCYRSVLHARAIAAAPAAIDIFFPRYVENVSKGERQKERERGKRKRASKRKKQLPDAKMLLPRESQTVSHHLSYLL